MKTVFLLLSAVLAVLAAPKPADSKSSLKSKATGILRGVVEKIYAERKNELKQVQSAKRAEKYALTRYEQTAGIHREMKKRAETANRNYNRLRGKFAQKSAFHKHETARLSSELGVLEVLIAKTRELIGISASEDVELSTEQRAYIETTTFVEVVAAIRKKLAASGGDKSQWKSEILALLIGLKTHIESEIRGLGSELTMLKESIKEAARQAAQTTAAAQSAAKATTTAELALVEVKQKHESASNAFTTSERERKAQIALLKRVIAKLSAVRFPPAEATALLAGAFKRDVAKAVAVIKSIVKLLQSEGVATAKHFATLRASRDSLERSYATAAIKAKAAERALARATSAHASTAASLAEAIEEAATSNSKAKKELALIAMLKSLIVKLNEQGAAGKPKRKLLDAEPDSMALLQEALNTLMTPGPKRGSTMASIIDLLNKLEARIKAEGVERTKRTAALKKLLSKQAQLKKSLAVKDELSRLEAKSARTAMKVTASKVAAAHEREQNDAPLRARALKMLQEVIKMLN